MAGWLERNHVGELHKVRMGRELDARGWPSHRYSQGAFPPAIQAALRHAEAALRHLPGLIAAKGSGLIAIDAKTRIPSTPSARYSISLSSLRAGLQFQGANPDISFYFVFSNLQVLTPAEITCYSTHGTWQHTGSYYFIDTRHAHTFSEVFGAAGSQQSAA